MTALVLPIRALTPRQAARRAKVDSDDQTIASALRILEARLSKSAGSARLAFNSPQSVKDHLRLTLATRDHEVFMVLFLDAQNRLILADEMFRGTLTQTSVYPREVVKRALEVGAASVIFSHNHPSGSPAPSRADETLTMTLRAALSLVDVRVLDHLIVGGMDVVSMAERGLL